jgi:diphosphomevalonate decarboxylase
MDPTQHILVTCECAPNIALVKYWGKQDEDLIIPLNSSLSVTLDKNVLKTKTSVMLIKKYEKFNEKDIKLWFDKNLIEFNESDEKLNEIKNHNLINIKRFLRVLDRIRKNSRLENANSYAIRICTYNTFPTACGLASSASGNACMALALSHAFGYNDNISELARLGSGSACRSCHGGFVKWCAVDDDNINNVSKQSIAVQLFESKHWPEMNILVLILNDKQKDVSSTKGMKTSAETSELLKERVKLVKTKRIPDVEEAIASKDFTKLAKLIMKDSNQFHAVCLDTYPPLFYLNQKSVEVISFVNAFNDYDDVVKAAYSFDAGPNAFIFIQDDYLNEFLQLLRLFYFENTNIFDTKFISNGLNNKFDGQVGLEEKKIEYFKKFNFNHSKSNDFIKFIMHSKIGDDPAVVTGDFETSLLDINGEPKVEFTG